MERKVIVLVGSCLFVLLTSVYCQRNYTCNGTVYEYGAATPIDSVAVLFPGGFVMTNEEGKYCAQFKTVKGPSLEFVKPGYTKKNIQNCKNVDKVEIELE